MKTYLDCIPCFLNQALRAGRVATDDENLIRELLNEVGEMIKTIPLDATPAEIGGIVYEKIFKITKVDDPFYEKKQHNIKLAQQIYPKLKSIVENGDDPLIKAIRVAVTGNIIDLAIGEKFDLEKDLKTIMDQDFIIYRYETFKKVLKNSKTILYIGDNSGEAVFDKVLIETILKLYPDKEITFAVRELPVINDVTIKEAKQIGIDKLVNVISSGTTAPGTIMKLCNKNFLDLFYKADMVISKGQGNYEGLSTVDRDIFFLLKAKCPVIANDIGVDTGEIIFSYSGD